MMLSKAQEMFDKVRHHFEEPGYNYGIQRANTVTRLYRIIRIVPESGGETALTPNMTSRELTYFLAGMAFTNETQKHFVWALS